MPATATRSPGKTMFVKEVLLDNRLANTQAVNDAWKAAGMEGSISPTLVNKMRSRMGLTGNLRGGRRKRARVTGTANSETPYRDRPAFKWLVAQSFEL